MTSILPTKARLVTETDFLTKSDLNKRPHLRATDERCSSHQLSSFRCSNLPGKATGTVRVQTDIRTRARRKSKWTTGGYSALRRCGCARSGKGTQFHCLKFRLGSAGEPTVCSHCYDVRNEDCYVDLSSWYEFWFARICIDMNVIWLILNLLTAIQLAETVSVAGIWVNTDLIENRFFYWNTTTGNNSSTDVPLLR